jgi:hypothetical protein
MSWLYGIIGNQERNTLVNQVGQIVVYDATQRYLEEINAQLELATQLFVEEITESHKERYLMTGGGAMQRRGGVVQSGAVKSSGHWDVAYPIFEFGDQIAATRVALAHMSLEAYAKHVEGIAIRAVTTIRQEILKRIFNNTAYTFEDDVYGALVIQPLANGDSVLYPPPIGSPNPATQNNYLSTTYAASAIDDTNNPYVTIRKQLTKQGSRGGAQNILVLINEAQELVTEALTGFKEVHDANIQAGSGESTLINIPNLPKTALVIGRVSNVWVAVWDGVPENYMVAVDMNDPAPLKRRVDPAITGLPRELTLVAEDEKYPLHQAHYEWRFGIGTGNRLNGVVLQLRGDANPYQPPSEYARIG